MIEASSAGVAPAAPRGGRGLAGILVPSGWLPVCDQIRRGSRMGPSLNRPLVALSLRLVTGRRRPPPPGVTRRTRDYQRHW
jgi:hypothetical protein